MPKNKLIEGNAHSQINDYKILTLSIEKKATNNENHYWFTQLLYGSWRMRWYVRHQWSNEIVILVSIAEFIAIHALLQGIFVSNVYWKSTKSVHIYI